MKAGQKLINKRPVKIMSILMIFFCILSIFSYINTLVFCLAGKEVYAVHTKDEKSAGQPIYEEQKGLSLRIMTAGPSWDINVWTNENNEMDKPIYIGIIMMFVLYSIVGIVAQVFVILIFRNMQKGKAFTNQNASFLLSYSILQIVDVFVLPLICYLITNIANNLSHGYMIFRDIGPGIINKLTPCVVYFVAAYIIHYGFELQDEVDHTI